ncbi:hypothetical protein T10_13156 [Trichinella papuae]|uniref:Uncharacterized protein n=1 Tax=Trichinella papuae TaxID=268474 RepID=A0A0V1MHV7_9BILA|nr:hypothetical protein T10_5538 [Trichinella papuae]KRZ71460.1 hypothetical protein T10_13156 [Trichinella papuae]
MDWKTSDAYWMMLPWGVMPCERALRKFIQRVQLGISTVCFRVTIWQSMNFLSGLAAEGDVVGQFTIGLSSKPPHCAVRMQEF